MKACEVTSLTYLILSSIARLFEIGYNRDTYARFPTESLAQKSLIAAARSIVLQFHLIKSAQAILQSRIRTMRRLYRSAIVRGKFWLESNARLQRPTKLISNKRQPAEVGDVARTHHVLCMSHVRFRYVGYGVWQRERKTTLCAYMCVCVGVWVGPPTRGGKLSPTYMSLTPFCGTSHSRIKLQASQRIAPANVRVEASPSITLSRSHYIALIIRVFIMSSANSVHLESRNRRRCARSGVFPTDTAAVEFPQNVLSFR